jgi:hypothetical protein
MSKTLSAVLAILLLAGCGSSGDDAKPSGPDAPSESSAPSEPDEPGSTTEPDTPTQDVAADTEAAKAALLTLSDFPAGWSEVPEEEDDSNKEVQEGVRKCLGPDAVELLGGEATATTGDFTNPDDDSTVDHRVVLAATEELAEAYIAGASSSEVPQCLSALYRELLPAVLLVEDEADNIEIGEINVGALNVGEFGDDGFAYRITAGFEVEGFSVDLVTDVVSVRVGRSVAGLNFQSTFSPTPIEQITEYAGLAASRLPG